MKYFTLILMLSGLMILNGCGWRIQCTKTVSINNGETVTTEVGNPVIQTGCLEANWQAVGLKIFLVKDPDSKRVEEPIRLIDKELIYSGMTGTTLNMMYREYTTSGLARSSFFQNVTYDTSNSDIISFQNLKFKIIKAGNSQITIEAVNVPKYIEGPSYFDEYHRTWVYRYVDL